MEENNRRRSGTGYSLLSAHQKRTTYLKELETVVAKCRTFKNTLELKTLSDRSGYAFSIKVLTLKSDLLFYKLEHVAEVVLIQKRKQVGSVSGVMVLRAE